MKFYHLLAVTALSAFAFTSCDKDDDNDNNNNNNGGSNATTFKVRMTDAPGNYSAMTAQITSVDAMIDGEWVNLSSENQMVSVLTLTNGEEEVIANDNTAETGHYTALRLTFGNDNSINTNDESGDHSFDLSWGVGVDHQVIIPIDRQMESGDDQEVLLDFNVASSISNSLGTYWFSPDVNWIEDEDTGVQGDVNGAVRGMITFTGDNGEEYMTWMNNDGRFMIRGMESGTYDMTIEGMSTNGGSVSDMQQDNIIVTQGQIMNMGSIQFN
jgi:hypothetical protein